LGKTVRVYLGVAVVAVIGLIVAVVTEQLVIGLAIVVIAGLGGMFLLRQVTADDEEEFFEAPEADEPQPKARSTASEPLATWEPEGLTPWTPPEDAAPTTTAVADNSFDTTTYEELDTVDLDDLQHLDALVEPADGVDDRADTSSFETTSFDTSSFDTGSFDGGTLEDRSTDGSSFESAPFESTTYDTNPFESSSLEASSREPASSDRGGNDNFANSMFGGGSAIEDVHSDDDIMAASHATELTVVAPDASDNSELAKLLAKVQSRLAAYE
jgi:hypothetical protein